MPNSIVKQAKLHYPQYRDLSDDELTLRYAREFPEYLETPDFKLDYDRITRKPELVAPTPKERVGAFESIGRRAAGGLQGGLGGPLWKGVELGARLLGADDLAQYSKEVSAEAREYDRQQRLKSANTGVAGFLGDVAGAAPSLLPILPAVAAAPLVGLARMTAAGIAAGATGGLSTFSDAEKAYYDKYKSEGMSDSEAESAARKSAAIPSIASGVATGTLTRFMPVGGVESVSGLFGKGAAASAVGRAAGAEAGKRAVAAGLTEAGVAASIKAGVARQVGLAEARALVATSIPKAFIKGATNEAIEEGIDQIAQSAIQKLSYDPELTLKQAIDNVINAAMVGGALGGSIQAAVQPYARKGAEAAIRQDKIYNELRVQAEAEAKSDATRREDRLEDEMRREKELKALDRTAAANLEATYAAQQKQRDAQVLADKTLIDTLNEKKRIEAEAKLTASQQSAVTAIRDLAGKTVGAKITDVTPEGYGPKEPPAATGAKIEIRKGEVGGMLSLGEVVLTSSGRKTTPFPQIKTDTNRKATATVKQVDAWLRDNAIAEARSRNDDFNARQFEFENPAKMPQASKDSMEEYLFGYQPVVPKPFLNPVTPPPPPAATGATGQELPPPRSPDNYVTPLEEIRDTVSYSQVFYNYAEKHSELSLDENKVLPLVEISEPNGWGHIAALAKDGDKFAVQLIDSKNDIMSSVGGIKKLADAQNLYRKLEAFSREVEARQRDKTTTQPAPAQPEDDTPPAATGATAEKIPAEQVNPAEQVKMAQEKQPWEMTRREYHDYNAESIIADYEAGVTEQRGYGVSVKMKPLSESEKADLRSDREYSERNRREEVESALRDGKPVPESVLADYPELKSEAVARIKAEEKAYRAQADIKAVTDRILVMIGRKVLPKNVKVVYEPESNFAAYYQSGEIVINAARIVNVEAVLVEEAVHAVWADPELQAAWDTVKKTVTIQDIDEQRLRAAADKRYPDNAELREEAAVAKLVRNRTPAIKGFLIAIRRAVAKAFGFHVKLSDIELIQNAAMSKLTADSKAVQISPPAVTGATAGDIKVGDTITAKSHQITGLTHTGKVVSISGDEIGMVNNENVPVLVLRKNVEAKPPTPAATGAAAKKQLGANVGARKATPEGLARVEEAKKRLRKVINNPDIVGKQRADMIEDGRMLIAFLEAHADTRRPFETGFEFGDAVAYTGEDAPDGFRSFIWLEGHRAGRSGVSRTKPAQPQPPPVQPEPTQPQKPAPTQPEDDTTTTDIRYAAAERDASDQPAFYSRLNRAVEQTTQNKASGAQWKATIKNSKLGTNADEYALVGVGDLEDGKTYSKQEVLDYLRANEVVVKDVTLGASMATVRRIAEPTPGYSAEYEITYPDGKTETVFAPDDEHAQRIAGAHGISDTGGTRFSDRVLPGAVEGSYREVLLTVPGQKSTVPVAWELVRPNGEVVTSYISKERADAAAKTGDYRVQPNYGEGRQSAWQDGHSQYSSIANPIVRLRLNERTTADGKRMLFLEEVQPPLGDTWHEVGGVKFEGSNTFDRATAYAKEHGGTVEKKMSGEFSKMPALFQKNWREIAFKWTLRHAAENGFDAVGWTHGHVQEERYDLSKHISRIEVQKVPGSTQVYLAAYDYVPGSDRREYGRRVIDKMVNPGELESYIGKELAAKVETMEWTPYGHETPQGETITQDHKVLSGLDLKVGGEGLKKLYDTDFRNVVNGLPAVKKAGQKVGTAEISTHTVEKDYEGWKRAENFDRIYVQQSPVPGQWHVLGKKGYSETILGTFPTVDEASTFKSRISEKPTPIHSLAITPAIRESVMGGQARFAASERGAGSELGALQGGVDGVDYLNWADRFRTNFITKYAPITKMERVLRESAGMGRAEFGMERWFERLAGVAGIAKASIIEMRMELDPLVAGDEKAFNNYIFWQYIERRSTLRAQALADVASARAMVADGTATDADRASIASNKKLADQMEFAGYDNPTVAKKNLDSIRANLAKSGALEDMDKAVAIYVKHTNLALDNIVDSGYLAQDRIDKYRSQFPVYIPIINLQIPDSKNGYQVVGYQVVGFAGKGNYDATKGRVGISDPNFKSKNALDAFDEYIFRMHAKSEMNRAKRRIYELVVTADRPDIARVEYDRLHSTESGFSLRVNGVDTMVVAHPEVVAAVNSFSDTASNTLNDFLRKANSVLKFGATSASLAFQVRNLLMGDLPTLALMSKAGITNPINAVTFVIDVITSFAHNFRASAYGEYSPLMLEFMKSGAMGSSMHSAIDSLGRDTQTGASSEGKISQYIIDAFGKMSNTIEQTSKLAGFKRLMDKAGVTTLAELNDPIKQMALVAEVRNYCGSPDFARNGSVMGLAMIRLGFVFVNPAMAGNASALERLTANLNKNSSGSEKKAALTAQIRLGFTVGLATMISYALRSQDDEAEESYDGLDKKSKEDNFHLITDKYDVDIEGNKVRRFVKIPKRGVIKIVANTMEAYLDYSRAKDPEDFTRMMGRVLEEVIPLDIKGDTLEERIQGAMASVNPAIRVPIEYATGMSFYSRQPTVPRSMRGAANSEQYRERTNENIKVLAGVFGVSPLKFKQALESATGGLTRTLLPEKESELNVDSPINIPIVKGYFSPTYRESADADTIDRLFMEAANVSVDRMRKATQFVDSREGMDVEAIYREAIDKLGVQNRDVVEKVRELLILKRSGVTKEERRITQLPPKQRAELIIRRHARTKPQDRDNLIRSLINKRVITRDTAMYMEAAGFKYKW